MNRSPKIERYPLKICCERLSHFTRCHTFLCNLIIQLLVYSYLCRSPSIFTFCFSRILCHFRDETYVLNWKKFPKFSSEKYKTRRFESTLIICWFISEQRVLLIWSRVHFSLVVECIRSLSVHFGPLFKTVPYVLAWIADAFVLRFSFVALLDHSVEQVKLRRFYTQRERLKKRNCFFFLFFWKVLICRINHTCTKCTE